MLLVWGPHFENSHPELRSGIDGLVLYYVDWAPDKLDASDRASRLFELKLKVLLLHK